MTEAQKECWLCKQHIDENLKYYGVKKYNSKTGDIGKELLYAHEECLNKYEYQGNIFD